MKSTPKISVIVSVYNGAKYLPKCLGALAEQTLKDIEIICIDDCSSDDTAQILRDFQVKDPRFKIITNSENLGVSLSRNAGIEQAKAEYIMFCDSDDYYETSTCEKMYQALTDNKVDVVISEIAITYHAHHEMKISDDNYYSLHFSGLQPITDNIIFYTDLAPTNKIFKKSLLDQYQIRFPAKLHYEDAYFCVAYFCVCQTAFFLNERLYNYIRHHDSTMSQTWSGQAASDFAIDHIYIGFQLFDFLSEHELLQQYNSLYWRLFNTFEFFSLMNSKSRKSRNRVKAAVREFVAKHQAEFLQSEAYVQAEIKQRSSALLYINSGRIKTFLLRFMPTYRLEVENIQRLRGLRFKYDHLIDELKK